MERYDIITLSWELLHKLFHIFQDIIIYEEYGERKPKYANEDHLPVSAKRKIIGATSRGRYVHHKENLTTVAKSGTLIGAKNWRLVLEDAALEGTML